MKQNESPEGRSVRLLRVGEQVRHALSDILMRGEVHDDVLASHLVSVTEVRMSPDLRHATAFVKPLLGSNEEAVLKALRTNTAYLQRAVASRVNTKYAAKLKFLATRASTKAAISTACCARPRWRGTFAASPATAAKREHPRRGPCKRRALLGR
jgi:ribosome-binding factor A